MTEIEWEYKDYVFIPKWPDPTDPRRFSPSLFGGELEAQSLFWNDMQSLILPDLRKVLDEGWETISLVGPSAFNLKSYEKTEKGNKTFGPAIDAYLTFGITLAMDLLTPAPKYKRTWYEVVDFRVKMRRRKKSQV